jgi:hypothetical protein
MSLGLVVYPTDEAPEITIELIEGDLRLIGWDLNQFRGSRAGRMRM